MTEGSGIDAVHNFWARVWQAPQDYDAIDDLVVEDFVLISGGKRIESRALFKEWVRSFSTVIDNLDFEIIESFENRDGSRVASIFRLTGNNNGVFGTTPDGAPLDISGTAVWAVRGDGMLLSNRVERNAFEVYQKLTGKA
jgi:hypothetical protein